MYDRVENKKLKNYLTEYYKLKMGKSRKKLKSFKEVIFLFLFLHRLIMDQPSFFILFFYLNNKFKNKISIFS